MTTTRITTGTPLACSQCSTGTYVAEYFNTAKCSNGQCGHAVCVSIDIAPYLDEGEVIIDRGGILHVDTYM